MIAIGIKTLKNKLSAYLQLVAKGETVLVTDRDRVVAQITAPNIGQAVHVSDAVMADLIRQGWATAPMSPPAVPPRFKLKPFADVMAMLDSDRSER
jgi:antitoxin (DNA-binding transcriptional repressor) of toxin-antitoxin stability system